MSKTATGSFLLTETRRANPISCSSGSPIPVPTISTSAELQDTPPLLQWWPLCSHTIAVELCSLPDPAASCHTLWNNGGIRGWWFHCSHSGHLHCNRYHCSVTNGTVTLKQSVQQQALPPLLTQLWETWTSWISFPCRKYHLSFSSLFFHLRLSTSASREG